MKPRRLRRLVAYALSAGFFFLLPGSTAAQTPIGLLDPATPTLANINTATDHTTESNSGQYCLPSYGLNVHPVGQMPSEKNISVFFDAEMLIKTAVIGYNNSPEAESRAWGGWGDPHLWYGTNPGDNVAIVVQAEIDGGCYDYDLTVADPPVTTEAQISERHRRLQQLQADPIFKSSSLLPRLATATTSTFPSGVHCVAGTGVSKIHDLGWIANTSSASITFNATFDAQATLMVTNPYAKTGKYVYDDDGGIGDLPEVTWNADQSGAMALFVSGYSGDSGCYTFDVTLSSDTTTSSDGITLSGTVRASGSTSGLSNATVMILDGPSAGQRTTTTSSGSYEFTGLTLGNTNVSATRSGYLEKRGGVYIDGVNTLDFAMDRSAPWSRSGTGNNVFDAPSYVNRVRIQGEYDGYSTNFIVRCDGRTVVNELLGTGWGATTYDGTHSVSSCSRKEFEVRLSSGVSWTFTEVR